VYIFRPAHSYKDARPAFCRVWHTEWNRVISRFFFRRGVRCTMGPIAVIGHDLYLNIVYPAVSSNMARKSPIHVHMGWCKYFPASHVWLLFPRGYILVRFQAMKNGDADKDPVGQSNIGYIRLQNSSMPSESNIDFAARPYTQQEHSWESVETNPGGWLFYGDCHMSQCSHDLKDHLIWLVVWNIFYFPFHIDVILPIDFHIFQRGWNHQPALVSGLFQVCFFLGFWGWYKMI